MNLSLSHPHPPSPKTHAFPNLKKLLLLPSFLCILYLLLSSFFSAQSTKLIFHPSISLQDHVSPSPSPTSLHHIVFGIASNEKSWSKRKDYVRLWWRPREMRGCVFLEKMPPAAAATTTTTTANETDPFPPICISQDTSRFRYTYRGGTPSAIRVARVVMETVNLNHTDVRWFVFGDDDTVFFPDNLVKTLSKYDHGLWYYIGANSESYTQNKFFSFGMAYGGAGFAISYPLARVLARVFDSCLERYTHLYGSDGRIHACLAELGVELTREPGFHQMDIRGNTFGLLAAHPIRPVVSLHHLDATDPIFPNMTAINALEHLSQATNADPQRVLQQTVCYDRWFSWTVSVSWGYSVQVFPRHMFLQDAIRVEDTYTPWKKGGTSTLYNLDNREHYRDVCRRAPVFFMDKVSPGSDGIRSIYKMMKKDNCTFDMASPRKLEEIRVFSHKLDPDIKQLQAPRRQCCDVLPSSAGRVMEIGIRECEEEELIYMH